MEIIFESAKLKIERAQEHVSELNQRLADLFKTDFCRVLTERDPEVRGRSILKVESTRKFPKKISTVIGDALHNQRAALDHMWREIVMRSGGAVNKYTKFPFRDTRDGLVGAINGGQKESGANIDTRVIDLIVDTVKPYQTGDRVLYTLNDADILDKHIDLVLTIAIVAVKGVSAVDGLGNVIEGITLGVEEGGQMEAIVSDSSDLEITDYGQPVFQVSFAEGQICEGQPVVPSLHQLTQLVSGIVQTIEKAYLSTS